MTRTSHPGSAGAGCVPAASGGSDVAAAAALRGDADQGGHEQRDAGDEQPDAEDEGDDEQEGPHPEDERPYARAGEGADDAGAVLDGRVAPVLRPVADGLVEGAPKKEFLPVEPLVPVEVVAAGQQAEQAGAGEHHRAAVLVAQEPVGDADTAEEDPDAYQEDGFDPHPTGTF